MATNLAIAALLSVTNTPRTKRRQETDRGIGEVFDPGGFQVLLQTVLAIDRGDLR
jgi:hypothetical protein